MGCVLVVDDDPSICRLFRLMLDSAGHQVLSAENDRAALRYIPILHPDLIVLGPTKTPAEAQRFVRATRRAGYFESVFEVTTGPFGLARIEPDFIIPNVERLIRTKSNQDHPENQG
jgi:hypothetical protein